MIPIFALTVIVVILAADKARPRIVAEWHRRRDEVEECETCGRKLTAVEARELRSDATDDDVLGIATGGGGTYMSATFCRRHYRQTVRANARRSRAVASSR